MMLRASACGKIILLGEHAVVYGQPALAVPVVRLTAQAELVSSDSPLFIEAPDIGLSAALEDLPAGNPLAFCVRRAANYLGIPPPPARMRIQSEIPVASGLGSGAAVSTAIVRVLATAAGRVLQPAEISTIVFEVEKILHGTPSGVDNTVIAYEQPVLFIHGQDPQPVRPGFDLHMIIAFSGIRSATKQAVGGVRERWQQDPHSYDSLFGEIGTLTRAGCRALQSGDIPLLGRIMNDCHDLLREIGVSLPALDRMVESARRAGAHGAKLSGAGLGGIVVALVDKDREDAVLSALRSAGSTGEYRFLLASR